MLLNISYLLIHPACLMFSLPMQLPDTVPSGTIIVANKTGNDVWFVERASGEVLRRLPTGVEPHEVEVSPDGRIAVVCNYGKGADPGHTLSVYDVEEGTLIHTIDLGEHTRPHGMFWLTGTDRMLVTAEGSRHLLTVDVRSGEIVQALYTDQDVSHMVAATPDGRRAFVPSIRTGNVTVFDLKSGTLLAQLPSGAGAEGIAMHPNGHEVWITNRSANTLTVFDTESLKLLATIPCADFPIRAKFTPDGRHVLVSNARSGDIAVADAQSYEIIRRIPLTAPPSDDAGDERYFAAFEGSSIPIGLVIPDTYLAYVASTRADVVAVISLKTWEITGFLPAGKEPDGINFSPVWTNPE